MNIDYRGGMKWHRSTMRTLDDSHGETVWTTTGAKGRMSSVPAG